MKKSVGYKVVILAAGRGSRLGVLARRLNKALLPVDFKAVISHIIEKFPRDVEVVVAVGHQKETLREYLAVAHPERTISFVEVDRITGPGSGPGYSLLQCRELLPCPFVLSTADTIVEEAVPAPTEDWLGVAPVDDTSAFNSVAIKDGLVATMRDKVKSSNTHAFIGLAGVRSYQAFWEALAGDATLIQEEKQLSNGLRALVARGMRAAEFTWFDTGSPESYQQTSRYFSEGKEDYSFSKPDEHLYFVNDAVVKYFGDPAVVSQRVARADALNSFVPAIARSSDHFYAYQKVSGSTLYTVLNERLASNFFRWLDSSFWRPLSLEEAAQSSFEAACLQFYRDKTKDRVTRYFESTGIADTPQMVNGVAVPSLEALLEVVDWEGLAQGVPSRIHGDLQFDNVIVTDDLNEFVLIDWRQDFAGLLDYGDLYYDLAKLYGGLIVSYDLVKQNKFSYERTEKNARIDVDSRYSLNECRRLYEQFLEDRGYDLDRVRVLTALIFLNMSPLHEAPFNHVLYHLGSLELYKALEMAGHWSADGSLKQAKYNPLEEQAAVA